MCNPALAFDRQKHQRPVVVRKRTVSCSIQQDTEESGHRREVLLTLQYEKNVSQAHLFDGQFESDKL
jgi:hypothetical protein